MDKSIILLNWGEVYRAKRNNDFIQRLAPAMPDYRWDFFNLSRRIFKTWTYCYTRTGDNIWPFNNKIVDILNCQMPAIEINFNNTFAQITDQRCQEILTNCSDKPLMVCWSGGIDSTVAIVSLLKNCPRDQLKHFAIYCNASSIWESPRFYYEFVKPNFKVINSTQFAPYKYFNEYYIVDGEPADCLWGAANMMYLDKFGDKSWDNDPDELINWIAQNTQDKNSAVWYYDIVKQNIQSSTIPVINYRDWFWWMNFNHAWVMSITRRIHPESSWQSMLTNHINWYDSINYQQWSLTNNHSGEKYDAGSENYKKAAKIYIYEFTKDKYFRWFHNKMHSNGAIKSQIDPWIAVLNDFSYLTLKDVNLAMDLAVTHLQQ